MRVILVVGPIFMVFQSDEVGIDGRRVKGERYKGIDSCGFGNELECPRLLICRVSAPNRRENPGKGITNFGECTDLLIPELDETWLIDNNLVTFIFAGLEELR